MNMTTTTTSRKRRNPYTTVACGENPCAGCQQVQAICLYERSTRFRAGRRGSVVSSRSDVTAAVAAVRKSSGNEDALSTVVVDDVGATANPDGAELSPQPIRPGSSDYYFNLAQQLLVDSSTANAGHDQASASRRFPKMAQDLRVLIQERAERKPQPLLSIIAMSRWLEILDFYEEEIGLLYPFLDVTDIRNQLRDASSHLPNPEDAGQDIKLSHKLEEVLVLVLAVMAVLEEPDVSGLCDEFAERVMVGTWRRAHTGNVSDHDVNLSILMSIYYFMTDRESLAWRNIGCVVRMLQELGYHSSTVMQHRFKSRDARERAKKVLWSAYMLDRRWSFGTGLPFAIHDSDIDYDTDFMDESLSSAYLKAMVTYCRIAAEVRDSALGMPSPNHAKDSARDLLDFKIGEWRRNLPSCLHFQADMDFDPLEGTRGQYRLRLLLYLRANQMRIIIHRKSALRSGSDAIDTSSINAMVQVAQDTIHVLDKLSQASNIYHAQQKTFNHFLESALSALLLVTCRSTAMSDRSCAAEIQLALEVIERLSTSSSITRKLADKLRCFATANSDARQPPQGSKRKQPTTLSGRSTTQASNPGLITSHISNSSRKLSDLSAARNENTSQAMHIDTAGQVLFLPRNEHRQSPTRQSPNSFPNTFTIPNQQLLQHDAQANSLDMVPSDPVPSLLYTTGSGSSGISPSNNILIEPSLIDVVDGLQLPTVEDWDGLLPDLGDFWMDYDKMITF
ncbi:hypothetical protein TruAng_009833 [Truncatella angustata]|nr:hypothetical protein TruAng_009833 [Truncatella angustata]